MTPAHRPGRTNADGGDLANATGADSRYAIRTERNRPEPSSSTVTPIASSCAFAPVHTSSSKPPGTLMRDPLTAFRSAGDEAIDENQ